MSVSALRPLDLKRHLFLRVCLFAAVVLLLGSSAALLEARLRVRSDIERTGLTIRQLITDEINRTSTAYNRTLGEIDLDLAHLRSIGALVHFCLRLTDIYSHTVASQCYPDEHEPPPQPSPLATALMQTVIGADAVYRGTVGQYPGITIGQIQITPNYSSELATLASRLGTLLLLSLMILLLSFFVYRPVRNALAPSQAILDTLARMEGGDLGARMPGFALIELDRIGHGFNHLADRLERTMADQRRLAHRLLSVREEERQHLSRELHDDFAQYLASLNAEAAYARELAADGVPALAPCADSIGRTTRHMMETLHRILHRLRPAGLEAFGLAASLERLIVEWNHQRRDATRFEISLAGDLTNLADDVQVSIYRIVQESLTNAVRHGEAAHVHVSLVREAAQLKLTITDDGRGRPAGASGGGFGLLGMEERVLALGGRLDIEPAIPRGTRVNVHLPAQDSQAVSP